MAGIGCAFARTSGGRESTMNCPFVSAQLSPFEVTVPKLSEALSRLPFAALVVGSILCLAAFSAVPLHAQNASVRGFVTDASNGRPLELASAVLTASDGTVAGAITNQEGAYLIPRVRPGQYAFRISFIGYHAYVDTLDLAPGQVLTISVELRPDQATLGEVVVQTERTEGAARVTAGRQTIRPADIELIPTTDVSGDLASYLTTLPGVVSTGDRGGQLFIRGGEPWQNLVQLDGILVYQPFHILGFYSAFPSDIINRADIYAGGYGSKFGGRISSVIDVATRNGNTQRLAGAVSISPFISTLRLEGPVLPGRVSVLGSVRRSVIEQGIEPLLGEPLPFDFGDAFGKFYAELSSKSRLSVTALSTHDRGRIAELEDGQSPEELRWQNHAVGIRYLVLPRILPVMADFHASYSHLNSEQGVPDDPTRTSTIENFRVSLDATFFNRNSTFDAGWAVEIGSIANELGGLFQNVDERQARPIRVAAYLEPEFIFGGLKLRPGLLFEHTLIKPISFEPRVRMVWETGLHQISGAAGLYRQDIVGLNDRRDATSVFTAWTTIPARPSRQQPDVRIGHIPEAVHAILGYRATPNSWLEMSVEGYYKWLSNLFIPEWTAFPRFSTRLQPASGRSRGFDARVEFRPKGFYAYVNYGLSLTRYTAEQAALKLWYGTETLDFRPPHDRRHQVNALASTSLHGFDLSVHWEFGSGLPFSQALGFDGFIFMNGLVDVGEQGSRRVIYARPFNAVLPTYHRLDVSIERTFDVRNASITAQASLINAYDRANLFYLDVFTLQRADQLPLVPSFGLKIAFD